MILFFVIARTLAWLNGDDLNVPNFTSVFDRIEDQEAASLLN